MGGPRISIRLGSAAGIAVVAWVTAISGTAPAAAQGRSVSPALVVAMAELPEHARPLHAIGDVDEDGRVDGRDRVLVRALARTPSDRWDEIEEATCPAAADFDLDGTIGDADEEIADALIGGESSIVSPSLYYQSLLPCRFERLRVASEVEAIPGRALSLWALRPDADASSLAVSVEQGRATVGPGSGRREVRVEVAADQPADEVLVLRIVLEGSESYLLSLPVEGGP